jgi:hypothetical protein
LLVATKLLPLRYAVRTWLVSTVALARDVIRLRWQIAKDRMAILIHMASIVPQLLREKRMLFGNADRSPQEKLDFLLRLTFENAPVDKDK